LASIGDIGVLNSHLQMELALNFPTVSEGRLISQIDLIKEITKEDIKQKLHDHEPVVFAGIKK